MLRYLAPLLLAFSASARFPLHSWDTLPSFFHSSLMCADVWAAADLAVIAKYPAVTIEKWQGCASVPRCYRPHGGPPPAAPCPTQQEATLATARALRAINPSISIFTWLDSLRVYSNASMNPNIIDISSQSCVRNALSPYLESHPHLLLHNASGGLALESYLHAHVFDHTQPAVRDLWRDFCVNQTRGGLLDGCGADASQQTGAYIPGLAPAVAAAWTSGHVAAVAATTAALAPAGGLVLGKLANQLGVSTNGVLQEGCGADNATVNTLRAVAAAALAANTRYLYECHFTVSSEDTIAAFLVGAGADTYYGTGPWLTPCGGVERPGVLDKALGAPLADGAYADGVWTRAFASGTRATFNADTGKGSVVWAA